MENIEEKVVEIIRTTLKLDNNVVLTDNIAPNDLAEWDSLGHLAILTELEDTFHIQFEIEDTIKIDTIGTIKEIVKEKVH